MTWVWDNGFCTYSRLDFYGAVNHPGEKVFNLGYSWDNGCNPDFYLLDVAGARGRELDLVDTFASFGNTYLPFGDVDGDGLTELYDWSESKLLDQPVLDWEGVPEGSTPQSIVFADSFGYVPSWCDLDGDGVVEWVAPEVINPEDLALGWNLWVVPGPLSGDVVASDLGILLDAPTVVSNFDPHCLDFTGDGLNDLVAGNATETEENRGAVYVFSGAEIAAELAALREAGAP